jgi:hypothetical protein
MKKKDDVNFDNLQSKISDLIEVLKDVYDKTKDNEVFEQLNETTKFYLENTK